MKGGDAGAQPAAAQPRSLPLASLLFSLLTAPPGWRSLL